VGGISDGVHTRNRRARHLPCDHFDQGGKAFPHSYYKMIFPAQPENENNDYLLLLHNNMDQWVMLREHNWEFSIET